MNNGLFVYPDYFPLFNVGDYVQSLAARQFISGGVDQYVCREALDKYSGPPLKVIMNGWFMHQPECWPPSDSIVPLFVSFHINSVSVGEMTRPESISYFKRHEPIGCRDRYTAAVLREHGVDAYFSGCMTLTLGESYKRSSVGPEVFFVDPFYPQDRSLVGLVKDAIVAVGFHSVVKAIAKKKYGGTDLKAVMKAANFYRFYREVFEDEVLVTANYIDQERRNQDFEGDEAKFAYAEKLLNGYARAAFVVTSRIHCALPCVGIGAPVIYVNNLDQSETSHCRLDGLLELFNVMDINRNGWTNSGSSRDRIALNHSFSNKSLHLPLKESLIERCKLFFS